MFGALIIAVIIFPVLVLISTKYYSDTKEFEIRFMGKAQTEVLKGICILVVFFHHFSHMVDVKYLELVYRITPIAVGIFFFLAGYATFLQFERMEQADYIEFWKKKIFRLYLPILIFTITYNNFLGGLLWMYFVTWLAYRFFDNHIRIMIIVIGNIAFILICVLLGLGNWWYVDVLPFCFGVIFARWENEILHFFQKKFYWVSGSVLSVILCGFCVLHILQWKQYTLFAIINVSVFTFLMILILMKVDLHSRIFTFLGKYSWEIFFMHQIIIMMVHRVIQNPTVVMIISLGLVIFMAYWIQKGWNILISRITRGKS